MVLDAELKVTGGCSVSGLDGGLPVSPDLMSGCEAYTLWFRTTHTIHKRLHIGILVYQQCTIHISDGIDDI